MKTLYKIVIIGVVAFIVYTLACVAYASTFESKLEKIWFYGQYAPHIYYFVRWLR